MVGARNRAQYPTIGLESLYATLAPHVGKYQFVVVDPWLTFGWADDSLTPTSVSLEHTYFDWSQGFHVVSDDNRVIISDEYFFPNGQFPALSHYFTHLWYVGETGGPTWPAAAPNDPLYVTRDYSALVADGWRPTTTTYRSTHIIAILMRYAPSTPVTPLP